MEDYPEIYTERFEFAEKAESWLYDTARGLEESQALVVFGAVLVDLTGNLISTYGIEPDELRDDFADIIRRWDAETIKCFEPHYLLMRVD